MFSAARLRLTLWYLAVLGTIVVLLSLALYDVLLRLQQAEALALGRVMRHGVVQLFARDEHALAWQIGAIDLGVLILAALGAYVLAGRTLRPIQEAMERQERFAVAASHELRTPLTVLQGTLEVALLRERTPAEYREVLRTAAVEAGRMGALIGNLLALARTQSDRDTLALEPLDLCEVACEAADGVRPLAERKGQTLEVALDGELPTEGDRLKLRQALTNLLDNAVTYTPQGGRIRLTARRERGRAVLAVRDTGSGIATRHLPHLFEPFYRVDCARGGSGHSGLGLALASWIAQAHGGHLAVESRVGVGTVFTLSLPLRARTTAYKILSTPQDTKAR
jgi:signal transduction histidine kinase